MYFKSNMQTVKLLLKFPIQKFRQAHFASCWKSESNISIKRKMIDLHFADLYCQDLNKEISQKKLILCVVFMKSEN